jgi:hypothetical protein
MDDFGQASVGTVASELPTQGFESKHCHVDGENVKIQILANTAAVRRTPFAIIGKGILVKVSGTFDRATTQKRSPD